jgi:NADH-dependent peroxiredoxin subunit F
VAVVGGGNSAVQAAIELCGIADKVHLVVRSDYRADPVVVDKLEDCSNIAVLKGYNAKEIIGGQTVEKFVVASGDSAQDLAVQGIFIEIGLDPNSEFARDAVKLNAYNEVVVDCRARTNVPGLFAAGDVTSGPDKQIIIAAGDGAKAALMAYEYLLYKK